MKTELKTEHKLISLNKGASLFDYCEECGEILDSLDRCGCDYNP